MNLFIFVASTKLKIDVSICDVPQKTVIDDSWNNKTITSHCGCTIKSNFSGKLTLASRDSCSPVFKVFDDNETLLKTLCENNIASFQTNVAKGDHFKLVFVNYSLIQSGNHGGIVNIYAGMLQNYITLNVNLLLSLVNGLAMKHSKV